MGKNKRKNKNKSKKRKLAQLSTSKIHSSSIPHSCDAVAPQMPNKTANVLSNKCKKLKRKSKQINDHQKNKEKKIKLQPDDGNIKDGRMNATWNNIHGNEAAKDQKGSSESSKKKKKRKKKKKIIENSEEHWQQNNGPTTHQKSMLHSSTTSNSKARLSALQQKMKAKLDGAMFRMINERLYTNPSEASFYDFQKDPKLFDVYHKGFREQVEKWPVNPLDKMIAWVKAKHRGKVIVDFGCGEAKLAQSVPNKVHSFDLVAANEHITACDMANVPLANGVADVAIFCLALMGSNLADFVREAHRVLRLNGIMKIAEVRSRFEAEDGGLQNFIQVIEQLGFSCRNKDQSNKMFVMLEFQKQKKTSNPSVEYTAKPCIYKRR